MFVASLSDSLALNTPLAQTALASASRPPAVRQTGRPAPGGPAAAK